MTADLDFTRLYDKWKLLKSLDVAPAQAGSNGRPDTTRGRKPVTPPPPAGPKLTGFPKALAMILTSLKRITVNYSDNSSSAIYGFLDSTQLLGNGSRGLRSRGGGIRWGCGRIPILSMRLAERGLISTDTNIQ